MESLNLRNVDETAELLHLTPAKIRDLIREGELVAVWNGRSYLVTEAAISEYLVANTGKLKPSSLRKKAA